jgi:hypothetical protein
MGRTGPNEHRKRQEEEVGWWARGSGTPVLNFHGMLSKWF